MILNSEVYYTHYNLWTAIENIALLIIGKSLSVIDSSHNVNEKDMNFS